MILTLTLLLAPGCRDEGPAIDEQGCRLDGEEAYFATYEAGCEAQLHCMPELDVTMEQCLADAKEALPYSREQDCFDGCTMQGCLDAIADYRATCPEAFPTFCSDETFYHNSKVCVERDW